MSEDHPSPHPFIDVRSLPSWLQAAVILGVPSVIAMFLVYMISIQMASRIATIEKLVALQERTISQLADLAKHRQEDADRTREHFDQSLGLLTSAVRQLCVAVARNPVERAGCMRDLSQPAVH